MKRKYGIVYKEVVQDPDLSLRAKGLYSVLSSYANSNRQCFPSINTLAEMSGVSRRTIERCLSELEAKGYLQRSKGVFTLM